MQITTFRYRTAPQCSVPSRLGRASDARSVPLVDQSRRASPSLLKRRLLTLWTNSYFVSTVGGAPLAVVKQYIENQKRV